MQLVLITTCLLTGFACAATALRTAHRVRRVLAYGAFMVAASAAVVTWVYREQSAAIAGDPVTAGLSAGYLEFKPDRSTTLTRQSATNAGRLASVPEMIARLESRLDHEPADAKGWSLLAKSYAYTGNESGVESAIDNAVRLGLDETTLRAQIAAVQRQR